MADSATVAVPIETKHGDGCTCRSVGEIHLDLVAASRSCPGDRNPHRAGSLAQQLEPYRTPIQGTVVITWPAAAKPPVHGAPLIPWQMEIHDHATGEQMLGVSGLRMTIGGESWNDEVICVDLTELVGDDGKPQHGKPVVPVRDPDNPERVRTAVFRYYVAEMRTTRPNPASVHCHAFPADDSEQPAGVGSCKCGMTWQRYQQLVTDEAAGIRYLHETARPVDQYGDAADSAE